MLASGCSISGSTSNSLTISTTAAVPSFSEVLNPIHVGWNQLLEYSSYCCHFDLFPWIMGEGNGNPLQFSCLENPMDGGAWWAAVHGVPKSRTRLSDFTFTFHFHALEKEMATHSSVLAWRIPGMEESGRLPSMGLHRVGHDWSDLEAAAAAWIMNVLDGI